MMREPSWWEQIVEQFFLQLMEPFDQLKSIRELVFLDSPPAVWGVFTTEEYQQVVIPGQSLVAIVAWLILTVAIIQAGQRMALSGMNPGARQSFFQLAGSWLMVSFLLGHLEIVFDMLFALNQLLVNWFYRSPDYILATPDFTNPETGAEINAVAKTMILFVIFLFHLWLNAFYIMRKYMILFYVMLAPLFIVMYLFPAFRGVLGIWLKELAVQIFVQTVHAIMLWVFLVKNDGETVPWLGYLVMLFLFIPLSQLPRLLLTNTVSNRRSMWVTPGSVSSVMQVGCAVRNAKEVQQRLSARVGRRECPSCQQ